MFVFLKTTLAKMKVMSRDGGDNETIARRYCSQGNRLTVNRLLSVDYWSAEYQTFPSLFSKVLIKRFIYRVFCEWWLQCFVGPVINLIKNIKLTRVHRLVSSE